MSRVEQIGDAPRERLHAKHLLEEIGEGCLYVSGSGQGTEPLESCPVARCNAPTARDRVDTAYILKYQGLPFFQWHGRKADGRFHPIGKIMRLTSVGRRALDQWQGRKGTT